MSRALVVLLRFKRIQSSVPAVRFRATRSFCEGVTIEDDVFIGHHVCFINDLFPRACRPDGTLQTDVDWKVIPIVVERRATIGSGAVILGGVTIGAGAIVGAGAVVTKSVASHTVVAGNPARLLRTLGEGEAP